GPLIVTSYNPLTSHPAVVERSRPCSKGNAPMWPIATMHARTKRIESSPRTRSRSCTTLSGKAHTSGCKAGWIVKGKHRASSARLFQAWVVLVSAGSLEVSSRISLAYTANLALPTGPNADRARQYARGPHEPPDPRG